MIIEDYCCEVTLFTEQNDLWKVSELFNIFRTCKRAVINVNKTREGETSIGT